jgi:stage V sporulation protein AA
MGMAGHLTPTLYLRLRKKVVLPKGKAIYLGQVAQILIEPEWEEDVKRLVLYEPKEQDGNLMVLDMLLIIAKVKQLIPKLTIETFGEPHVLIELTKSARSPSLLLFLAVCLLLFIGSGLAIMNFHADVNMMEVHQKLYTLLTGNEQKHPLLLQIPYSFGIGAGMMIFFNRVFKRKFNEEPNPLEVEMFKYQESLNQYVINEEYRKAQQSSDST